MPEVGSGKLVGSFGPFKALTSFFLATYVASAVEPAPSAKLGTTDPSGNWTAIGLLQGDDITITNTEPTLVDDRRGFKRVLFNRAISQAGSSIFEELVVETDPETVAKITGETADSIGSGGKSLKVTYDVLYDRSALFYTKNAFTETQERYIHVPHCQVRYVLDRGDEDILVLRCTVEALQFTEGSENYLFELGRFD